MTYKSDERRRAGGPIHFNADEVGGMKYELRAIKDRHRISCPDNASQQYAEQAHADVLWLLSFYGAAEHR